MAKFEKQLKQLKKSYEAEVTKAWKRGYDYGIEVGSEAGHAAGFDEGVAAHKAHVQSRLKASEELSLSVGKGTEAVRMREMAEFLAWEYDPEEAERQAKIADENGF